MLPLSEFEARDPAEASEDLEPGGPSVAVASGNVASGSLATAEGGNPSRRFSTANAAVTLGPVWLIAALALVAGLYFGRPVLLPVVLALFLSVVLGPLVRRMERFVPPPISATAILLGFLLVAVGVGWQLARPAQEWVDGLPSQLREISRKSRAIVARVESYREVADEVDELASAADKDKGQVKVAVETAPPLSSRILSRTRYLLGLLGASLVLVFFMLAGRNAFLIRLVRLVPALRRNCRATTLLHRLEESVARYFLTVALINAGLGIAVGLSVWLLGVGNPLLWGVLAALLNFVPYLGAAVGVSLLAVSSVISGDSALQMAAPPIAYLILTTVEGTFVTPAILGRRFALSPVVILLSLFFWGWIWGFPGTFLAVPILVVLHIVSEQIPDLKPVRRLLERGRRRRAAQTAT